MTPAEWSLRKPTPRGPPGLCPSRNDLPYRSTSPPPPSPWAGSRAAGGRLWVSEVHSWGAGEHSSPQRVWGSPCASPAVPPCRPLGLSAPGGAGSRRAPRPLPEVNGEPGWRAPTAAPSALGDRCPQPESDVQHETELVGKGGVTESWCFQSRRVGDAGAGPSAAWGGSGGPSLAPEERPVDEADPVQGRVWGAGAPTRRPQPRVRV